MVPNIKNNKQEEEWYRTMENVKNTKKNGMIQEIISEKVLK